jgi:transcriptional regulator GlxA family with amidase domain
VGARTLFDGRDIDHAIILLSVRWYLRSELSLRDPFERMAEQGLSLAHMQYLTRWRMKMAADRPPNSRHSISIFALALGHDSESALSPAFERVMQHPFLASKTRSFRRSSDADPRLRPSR